MSPLDFALAVSEFNTRIADSLSTKAAKRQLFLDELPVSSGAKTMRQRPTVRKFSHKRVQMHVPRVIGIATVKLAVPG